MFGDGNDFNPFGPAFTTPAGVLATPASSDGSGSDWNSNLQDWVKVGAGITSSILNYKLLEDQIHANQSPSVGIDPRTGSSTGQAISLAGLTSGNGSISPYVLWIAIGLGVILILKR